MRRRTYYLALLPAALALMAFVPIYPAQATEYPTFGRSFPSYRISFLPATEIVGVGLDWTQTTTGCALYAAQRTRFQVSPGVIAVYVASAFDLWLFVVLLISRTSSEAARKAIMKIVSAGLMLAAGGWLQFYGLVFLVCPPDLPIPSVVAGVFAVLAVGLGGGLITRSNRFAHLLGPRDIRPPIRVRVPKAQQPEG